jgi:hypothetical protein
MLHAQRLLSTAAIATTTSASLAVRSASSLYRCFVAPRERRSISLPGELAAAIENAAAAQNTSVSSWIAEVAAHRLRLEAGRRGIGEWERDNEALTVDELAEGLSRVRALLK